jgi:hypothetical protein
LILGIARNFYAIRCPAIGIDFPSMLQAAGWLGIEQRVPLRCARLPMIEQARCSERRRRTKSVPVRNPNNDIYGREYS